MMRAVSSGAPSSCKIPGPKPPGPHAMPEVDRARSLLLGASAAVAVCIALMSWGRYLAWISIVYAFAAHVRLAVAAISRRPFLGFNSRWLRFSLASFVIAMIYGPVLLAGATLAWPALEQGDRSAIFLVNRRAYLGRSPEAGEVVWIESKSPQRFNMARVIAGKGQEVAWSPGRFAVDGLPGPTSARLSGRGRFRVPENLLLICFEFSHPGKRFGDSILIESDMVIGKAWAQSYPLGEMRLLR
ncbi:hypothetical protein EP7_004207 [Isosphaeraceae bacterium EP7]